MLKQLRIKKKTANETLDFFLVVIVNEEYKNKEGLMYQICCKNISIKINHNKTTSYLYNTDTTQRFSKV